MMAVKDRHTKKCTHTRHLYALLLLLAIFHSLELQDEHAFACLFSRTRAFVCLFVRSFACTMRSNRKIIKQATSLSAYSSSTSSSSLLNRCQEGAVERAKKTQMFSAFARRQRRRCRRQETKALNSTSKRKRR